jgi:cell division protein ZapB
MNSEFHQLAQKIEQLAALAKTMRAENTELRLKVAELASTNTELTTRIQQAHERVTEMLEKLPLAEQETE